MEIVYLKNSPLGEFYYNPETCKGVAIPGGNLNPLVLGMDESYEPFSNPKAVRLDVKEEVFEELLEAAVIRDEKKVNELIIQYFS